MTAPRESFLEANGLRHHVITWDGEGETIVLCHGYLDLAWSWRPVAERLCARGLRVVAFDWRGHGESEWAPRGSYYHFPDYVRDLHALLPRLAPTPVHLVGHSMGGTACAMYAGSNVAPLRSLALLEGLGPPDNPPEAYADRLRTWLRTVDELAQKPGRPMHDVADTLKRMRGANPGLGEELGLFLAERATRPLQGGGRGWTFDPLHKTTAPIPFRLDAFTALLSRITTPTLLVSASNGFRLSDEAARIAAFQTTPEHVVLEGATHMMHWLASDALAEHVARFVSSR